LKQRAAGRDETSPVGLSPAFSRGLIEAVDDPVANLGINMLSPAFSRGLIEASNQCEVNRRRRRGYPRHLAGASLKHRWLLLPDLLGWLVIPGI